MTQMRKALTIIEVLVLVAILGLALLFFSPLNRGGAGEAARRNQCKNHLKNIALALHIYHEEHGHLPPAYTVDADGNRLHSWRTLILPYLEEKTLYDSIDLTKPWDDPANAPARGTVLDVFECPSTILEPGMTTYLAAVGPDWAFAGETPRNFDDFKDGTSSTICVVEAKAERSVHWMAPEDFADGDAIPFGQKTEGGGHPGVALAAYADGHTEAIEHEIDPAELRARLTIAGGEKVDP